MYKSNSLVVLAAIIVLFGSVFVMALNIIKDSSGKEKVEKEEIFLNKPIQDKLGSINPSFNRPDSLVVVFPESSPKIFMSLEKKRDFFIQACKSVGNAYAEVIYLMNWVEEEGEGADFHKFYEVIGWDELKDFFEEEVFLMKVKIKRLEQTEFDKIDDDLFSREFYNELKDHYETAIWLKKFFKNINNKQIIEVRFDRTSFYNLVIFAFGKTQFFRQRR